MTHLLVTYRYFSKEIWKDIKSFKDITCTEIKIINFSMVKYNEDFYPHAPTTTVDSPDLNVKIVTISY